MAAVAERGRGRAMTVRRALARALFRATAGPVVAMAGPVVAAAAIVIGVVVAASSAAGAQSSEPVHERYHGHGAYDVVVESQTYASGQTGVLYRPVPANGDVFPTLVWGNGSGAAPEADYPDLLRAVASHGFVITATDHQEVGTGEQLMESLDHLRGLAADPTSPVHGIVDVETVGIFGHSQGAGGSTKAATELAEFDAVALLALPARPFAFEDEKKFDTDTLTAPTLLMSGTLDIPISPTIVVQDHYARLDGPGAMAMISGADHLVFSGDGGIGRGYIVAWFSYLLRGDVAAASAFVGDDPELLRHPAFESQAVKALPAPVSPSGPAAADSGDGSTDGDGDATGDATIAASATGVTSAVPSTASSLPETGAAVSFGPALAILLAGLVVRLSSSPRVDTGRSPTGSRRRRRRRGRPRTRPASATDVVSRTRWRRTRSRTVRR